MLRNRKKIRKKIWRAYDARELKRLSDIIRGGEKTYWITFTFAGPVIDGSTIFPLWPDVRVCSTSKPLTPELIESACQHLEHLDG